MGKKKAVKTKKSTTVSLNDFLGSSSAYTPPGAGGGRPGMGAGDPIIPTAPRASRGETDVDIETLPRTAPFLAHVGNLRYETEEGEIEEFFSFRKATVATITMARDEVGRSRGHCKIEFEGRMDLKLALEASGEMLNGRAIRCELPGAGREGGRGGGGGFGDRSGGGGGGDRYDQGPMRSEEDGNWRSGQSSRGGSSGSGGGGGGGGFGGRGGGGGGDRYGDRYGDRGGDRYGDRGGGGGNRYGDRDRGGGYDRAPAAFDDPSDWRRAPRDSGGNGGGFNGRSSGGGGGGGGFDRFERRNDGPPPASSRPRLNLAPRTKPVEDVNVAPTNDNKPSPFGAARPVDTAAKLDAAKHETRASSNADVASERATNKPSGPRADPFGGAKPVDTASKLDAAKAEEKKNPAPKTEVADETAAAAAGDESETPNKEEEKPAVAKVADTVASMEVTDGEDK